MVAVVRAWPIAALVLMTACEPPPEEPVPDLGTPEVCGNEIDDDLDGLIDCDDARDCGGPNCGITPGPIDTAPPPELLQVVDFETLSCDFAFGQVDCAQLELCSFTFKNDSPDPATLDASCEAPKSTSGDKHEPAIWFETEGTVSSDLNRHPVDAGEEVVVTLYYDCFVLETIHVDCTIESEGTDGPVPLASSDMFSFQGTFIP